MSAEPTRIWIETPNEQEALCMLGALGDYRARLTHRGKTFVVEVAVDRPFGASMRALHRAVRNCLTDHGLEAVVFHVAGRDYTLSAA
jgi:hypothetical protein